VGAEGRQNGTLFRAFQANLLSLVSHELRTPLMGVLNALTLLEESAQKGASGEIESAELLKMARQNAQRLHRSLAALLDLASLESGSFHARLKEIDLARLIQTRIAANQKLLQDAHVDLVGEGLSVTAALPILADPQKLGRAIDLCFQVIIAKAVSDSELRLRFSASAVELDFQLRPELRDAWDQAWSQSLAGKEGGVSSPYSAFAGVVQSEDSFLTRLEEGLGGELLLIHEIMRIHHGQLNSYRNDSKVHLSLELENLSAEQALQAVLFSRAYQISTELGSVALILVQVPLDIRVEAFCQEVRGKLFRTTDAVYALVARHQLALVVDDCKLEDTPKLMRRISQATAQDLLYGSAHCPTDGIDPSKLLAIAEQRLLPGGGARL
jgi:hypothetical protein